MDCELSDYQKRILTNLYQSLIKNLGVTGENCIFLDIIKSRKNEIYNYFSDSSTKYIDSESIIVLKKFGFIRETDNIDQYSITAKGIWFVESNKGVSVDDLVMAIDDQYCDIFKRTSITERNKVILASMLFTRTFSQNCSIDMRSENNMKESWWKIFLDVNDYLIKNEVISEKSTLREYKSKSKIEHPASDIIRHTDKVPRATKSIFSKTGKNQYYLDIVKSDGSWDIDALAYIIFVIFSSKLYNMDIDQWCEYIVPYCRIECLDIHSSFECGFYSSEYDDMMFKGFERAFEMYSSWI